MANRCEINITEEALMKLLKPLAEANGLRGVRRLTAVEHNISNGIFIFAVEGGPHETVERQDAIRINLTTMDIPGGDY